MKKGLILAGLNFLPLVAFAQFGGGGLTNYMQSIVTFINNVIIPLIIAAAVLVFIWGMFSFFILGASDEEKKQKGKDLMMWGLIGFVVMFSLLGIINLLVDAVGLKGGTLGTPQIPNNIR